MNQLSPQPVFQIFSCSFPDRSRPREMDPTENETMKTNQMKEENGRNPVPFSPSCPTTSPWWVCRINFYLNTLSNKVSLFLLFYFSFITLVMPPCTIFFFMPCSAHLLTQLKTLARSCLPFWFALYGPFAQLAPFYSNSNSLFLEILFTLF